MPADESNPEHTVITRVDDLSLPDEKYAHLVFLAGPQMGQMHLLKEGRVVLGRSADADIPIADLGISRRHCQIDYSDGVTVIKDLGSTNGTFVNGHRIQERQLGDGDKVQLSTSTIFKYTYQGRAENVFHQEIYKMATTDALTGAYNKRYFEERVREEFSFALRNNVPLSLVLFDLDHFKRVNDEHGHPAGDHVLKHVGGIARSIVRQEDILARYGGEEFVILLKGSNVQGAVSVAERLRKAVEAAPVVFEGRTIGVTVSVGIAVLAGQNFADWSNMLKCADELLYQSKRSGRNRVSFVN
ncbi:MAG TPA: GGDEF domain-containing protein [bacterium]|nr:GGDEF domain-containing protein [bacterium]